MRTWGALCLVALLAAGCLDQGPRIHAGRPFSCQETRPGDAGERTEVQVAWGSGPKAGSTVPGACVTASEAPFGLDTTTRRAMTNGTGETVVRLNTDRSWNLRAVLEDPDDPFCAFEARTEAPFKGASRVELRMMVSPRVCT